MEAARFARVIVDRSADREFDYLVPAAMAARIQVGSRVRLPFRNRTWRGDGGNWQGAGVGSSIDFQDHRPYLPGDDPRYIDWQAYARTGVYSMKLYREEVSPRVDVALDVSASMFFDDEKRQRAFSPTELETTTTRASLPRGKRRSSVSVSIPFRPGMSKSRRTRSGPHAYAIESAACPLAASISWMRVLSPVKRASRLYCSSFSRSR